MLKSDSPGISFLIHPISSIFMPFIMPYYPFKKMKKQLLLLFLCLPFYVFAQKDVYLFAYFVQNGQDGLHFAYSYDGVFKN